MERCAASARRALIADLVGTTPIPLVGTTATPPVGTTHLACTEPAALAPAGQILSGPLPVHRDLVAGSPDETLQLVATQCTHSQAPALLCPECTTTRDARAARNPNPESSR